MTQYQRHSRARHQLRRGVFITASLFTLLATLTQTDALAKKNQDAAVEKESIPAAAVYGMAGERYIFFGTGGITVEQTPKPGMWHSNMKTYKISIDGSNVSGGAGQTAGLSASNFAAATVESDFQAVPGTAYFVASSATCTLPSASGSAGREVLVCNTGAKSTITYATKSGESVSGNASGVLTNTEANRVDKFISDGKNWYRE